MLSILLGVFAAASGWRAPVAPVAVDCRHLPMPPATAAAPNDNRTPAGSLRNGVLTLRLVARDAAWRPDGPSACALWVHAFAEEGRAVQVPGPLIRVPAGTRVRASIRNALATPIWVRGFQDRRLGVLDSTEIAAGAAHDFQFAANTVGAWYYWAGASTSRVIASNADGQLVGAFVVDSASTGGAPKADRVLVLTRFTPNGKFEDSTFQINAFNGRSWPNTERLTYTVGDSVHWSVINASNGIHEMHLHGFFFRLTGKAWYVDSALTLPGGGGGMRVTAVLRPGEWLKMSWSPDRAGNWLYHCHLLAHMSGAQRMDRMPGATAAKAGHQHAASEQDNHALHDMGGLVLGLDIRPSRNARASATSDAASRRTIDVFANARAHRFGEKAGYGFVVQDGSTPPAQDSIRIPGTPLILTKGEPVRITVHNRLAMPISVHWHGIELDSYFDGVGGFSGAARQIAPAIAPNDSFVVRFTPPRAGTYMYHVHGESGEELASGLYAPLIVTEPGEPFDPRTDRVFVLADGGPGSGKDIFINGTASPDTAEMIAGTPYRLRFIFIAANDVYFTTVSGPDGPVIGQQVAVDGYSVASALNALKRPIRFPTGPGHTQDLAFTPVAPGDYSIRVQRFGYETGVAVPAPGGTVVPIRVRAP